MAISLKQAWKLKRQMDICPEISEKLASCDTPKGFNTYSLYTSALQIPYERFDSCLHALHALFEEAKEQSTLSEISWIMKYKIEERKREEVIRLSLALLEVLKQRPWTLYRFLDRDDIYSMLHLSLPRTWLRTAQTWTHCLQFLKNRENGSASPSL
jgi:hypothetical protein